MKQTSISAPAVMKNGLPGIKTYYPCSPLLKKHIQYYYFMQSDSNAFDTSYVIFTGFLPEGSKKRFEDIFPMIFDILKLKFK
ncbi:MAG TPA: hypothetical protein VK489_13255 [Ferruginibacter sp.]|nr:hypothetical protein [Ferruginibacter sp.]